MPAGLTAPEWNIFARIEHLLNHLTHEAEWAPRQSEAGSICRMAGACPALFDSGTERRRSAPGLEPRWTLMRPERRELGGLEWGWRKRSPNDGIGGRRRALIRDFERLALMEQGYGPT